MDIGQPGWNLNGGGADRMDRPAPTDIGRVLACAQRHYRPCILAFHCSHGHSTEDRNISLYRHCPPDTSHGPVILPSPWPVVHTPWGQVRSRCDIRRKGGAVAHANRDRCRLFGVRPMLATVATLPRTGDYDLIPSSSDRPRGSRPRLHSRPFVVPWAPFSRPLVVPFGLFAVSPSGGRSMVATR